MTKIPVILDTDIGGDIDDTWALAFMLKSPKLDIKLVATDTGDTTYRAKIVGKMLEIAGRSDVPIAVGIPLQPMRPRQAEWVAGYDLAAYPGQIYDDGVGAIIDTIMTSDEPVTLVCTGPVPNIAAALAREPRIAERSRFVGMHGSIRRGYGGSFDVSAEANVKAYPFSLRRAFAAPWPVTITPLDTCGLVQLGGERFRRIRECQAPLIQSLIENYDIWNRLRDWGLPRDSRAVSSILYDTVAVYLAFSEELLVMEEMGLRVTDDGYTVVDPTQRPIRCATEWKDLDAFKDLLVERLTS